MGFFDRLYYGKAGKRDYSEMDMPKTRVSLFFLVLKDHFFDVCKVNLLQLVFWLPFLAWTYINFVAIQSLDMIAMLEQENGTQTLISTIGSYLMMWLIGLVPCIAITGPSSAGAAYVMRNWARDQHVFLFSDFKDAIKGNWKQGLGVSLITSIVPVAAYTAFTYYGGIALSNVLMILPMILVFLTLLLWTLMLPLLYPMMVGYELRFKDLLRNALLMAVGRLPQMIAARLITFIPMAVLLIGGLYFGNVTVILIITMYYIFFGFAFSRLVYASFANGVFDQFLNSKIEGAPVRQGLRPQTDEDEMIDDDEDDEDEDDEEA